ncbi:hypothetical protein HK097_004993, partial [Rhizophlyctis rosea]
MLTAMEIQDDRKLRVAYYITGHGTYFPVSGGGIEDASKLSLIYWFHHRTGFGHSTRAVVIIDRLLQLHHTVTIVTSAPQWIFSDQLTLYPSLCSFRSISTVDPGVIQSDPVTVDEDKTMQKLKDFLDGADEIVECEAEWMREWRPDVVCLDAAFLPAIVAKKVGVPSVVVSNFSFDAIFHAIARTDPEHHLSQTCQKMYSATQYLIRLPGHIHFPFLNPSTAKIVDVPLVVRKVRRSKVDIRTELSISLDANCCLITFGGFELVGPGREWTAERVLPEGWYGVIAGPYGEGTAKGRLRWVPGEKYHLPDLINAVDVVVGKLGYGTCSEVVALRKPLVYVPRPKFVEE